MSDTQYTAWTMLCYFCGCGMGLWIGFRLGKRRGIAMGRKSVMDCLEKEVEKAAISIRQDHAIIKSAATKFVREARATVAALRKPSYSVDGIRLPEREDQK